MMSSGGLLCIDNTLWKGRVYDSDQSEDNSTKAIRAINEKIKKDKKRVDHAIT